MKALRRLTEAGLPVERAFGLIEFRYAATADQFLTIAKLRAARRLWARVAEVAGGPPDMVQHAVTSGAMMTGARPVGEHAAHHARLLRGAGPAGPTR